MSKVNFSEQWDNGFRAGMTHGYRLVAKTYANSSNAYEQGYDKGYELGRQKAKKENVRLSTNATSSFCPWQYST